MTGLAGRGAAAAGQGARGDERRTESRVQIGGSAARATSGSPSAGVGASPCGGRRGEGAVGGAGRARVGRRARDGLVFAALACAVAGAAAQTASPTPTRSPVATPSPSPFVGCAARGLSAGLGFETFRMDPAKRFLGPVARWGLPMLPTSVTPHYGELASTAATVAGYSAPTGVPGKSWKSGSVTTLAEADRDASVPFSFGAGLNDATALWGFFVAPRTAQYEFELTVAGAAVMYLDGAMVAQFEPSATDATVTDTVVATTTVFRRSLNAGARPILIRYYQVDGGRAALTLRARCFNAQCTGFFSASFVTLSDPHLCHTAGQGIVNRAGVLPRLSAPVTGMPPGWTGVAGAVINSNLGLAAVLANQGDFELDTNVANPDALFIYREPRYNTVALGDSGILVNLPSAPLYERFLVEYEATLSVPVTGVWLINMWQSFGAQVWVDGVLVINRDAAWTPVYDRAYISLTAGPHLIRVVWLRTWEYSLSIRLDMACVSCGGDYAWPTLISGANGLVFRNGMQQPGRIMLAAPGARARAQADFKLATPAQAAFAWPANGWTLGIRFRTRDGHFADRGSQAAAALVSYVGAAVPDVPNVIEENDALELLVSVTSAGELSVRISGSIYSVLDTVDDGVWHSLAIAYDRTLSQVEIVLDGYRRWIGAGPSNGPAFTPKGCLLLGQAPRSEAVIAGATYTCGDWLEESRSFEGLISTVTLWNYAAPLDMMQRLARGGFADSAVTAPLRHDTVAQTNRLVFAYLGRALTPNDILADAALSNAQKADLVGGQDALNTDGASAAVYTADTDLVAWRDEGPFKLHASLRGQVRPFFMRGDGVDAWPPADQMVSRLRFWPEDVVQTAGATPTSNKIVTIKSVSTTGLTTHSGDARLVSAQAGSTSAPLGGARLGRFSTRRPLHVIDWCWDSHLVLDGLANYNWNECAGTGACPKDGFTVSVYYRRNGPAGQSTLAGVGSTNIAPWSISLPSAKDGNTVTARINMLGGAESHGFEGIADHGVWHHVLLSYDRTGKVVSFFVDGAHLPIQGLSDLGTTAIPVLIGSSAAAEPGANRFCGQLHDVRIYSRPVTRTEARAIWNRNALDLYFGDGRVADCAVSEWGAWSQCLAVGTAAATSTIGAGIVDAFPSGSYVRSRSRSVVQGSVGCPSLRQVELCDARIVVEPANILVSATNGGTFTVKLSTPPLAGQVAVVELDNVASSTAFSLDKCRLFFSAANYSTAQSVFVSARISPFVTGTQTFDLILRAYNYTVGVEYPSGIGVTTANSRFVDPDTGLLLANQTGGDCNAGGTVCAVRWDTVLETAPVTIAYTAQSGHCGSWGDPHILQYENEGVRKYVHFQDQGDFTLVQSCDGEFVVQARHYKCGSPACNRAIIVKYRNSVLGYSTIGQITGTEPIVIMSTSFDDGIIVTRFGNPAYPSYRISAPNGASVTLVTYFWYGEFYYANVEIVLPPIYFGRVGGICGSWDQVASNDMRGGNGVLYTETQVDLFGRSWAVKPTENLFAFPNNHTITRQPNNIALATLGSCDNVPTTTSPHLTCGGRRLPDRDPLYPKDIVDVYTPPVPCPTNDCDNTDEVLCSVYGICPHPPTDDDDVAQDDDVIQNCPNRAEYESTCNSTFLTSSLAQQCRACGTNNEVYRSTCLFDACATDGMAFLPASYVQFLRECIQKCSCAAPGCNPSPTPSPTPSVSATPSATPSTTRTASPTPSTTATATSSPTRTPTPSTTPSTTSSATPSTTPTRSPTPTPSTTSTASATPSTTRTASPTPSTTATSSPTPSTTSTASVTPSTTATATRSPTPTPTRTPTNSPTPSTTATASPTPSTTASSTATATATASATPTSTPSRTPSTTSSATPTPSTTSTASVSPTPTPSITPTNSPTPSTTATASPTPSTTTTATPTPSTTTTASPTPSTTSTSSVTPSTTSTTTPTPSTTNTVTATPSRSPTPSTTNTASASPTPSTSSTMSATPTPSTTATASRTPSTTPSATASVSPTPSTTNTASPTPSTTPTATATRTPTPSTTSTTTATPTPSNTPSRSPTPSTTSTASRTPTPSTTSTTSATPSRSPTPSTTNTASATPSTTSTASGTPTPSITPTPSNTPSRSPTPSTTSTASRTPTPSTTSTTSATPSNSPTSSTSRTPTPTPSTTSTASATPTPSNTPSNTPTPSTTNTATPTPSTSRTPTPSTTPTATATATATRTPTPSTTSTASATPTPSTTSTTSVSPSPSSTMTATPTPSTTQTASSTPSTTPTRSPTPSVTPTSSPTPSITPTPSVTPSPCVPPGLPDVLNMCPALCSGHGLCTCEGCKCSLGWTGPDCGTAKCNDFETNATSIVPATGTVYSGFEVRVTGNNLGCEIAYECVFRDQDTGKILERAPAVKLNARVAKCTVPSSVEEKLYPKVDTPDNGVLCPFVAPLRRVLVEVHEDFEESNRTTTAGPAANWVVPSNVVNPIQPLFSAEYTVARCQPATRGGPYSPNAHWRSQPAGFDFFYAVDGGAPNTATWRGAGCDNGGFCSAGGQCVCPPGFCGAHCEYAADEEHPVTLPWVPNPSPLPAASPGPSPGASPLPDIYGAIHRCQPQHRDLREYAAVVGGDWIAESGSDVEGLLSAGRNVRIGTYSVGDKYLGALHPAYLHSTVVQVPNPAQSSVFFDWGYEGSRRVDLFAGGWLDFISGAVLSGGDAVYSVATGSHIGNDAGVLLPGEDRADTNRLHPFAADTAGALLAARWQSASLARLPRTGTSTRKWSTLTLTGTRPDINVFHVPASELATATEIRLELTALPSLSLNTTQGPFNPFTAAYRKTQFGNFANAVIAAPVTIINVLYDQAPAGYGPGLGDWFVPGVDIDDIINTVFSHGNGTTAAVIDAASGLPLPATEIYWRPMGFEGDFWNDAVLSKLVWNVPFASNISIPSGVGIKGSLLAPYADLFFGAGRIDGQVILGGSWSGGGQVNFPYFQGMCTPALLDLINASSTYNLRPLAELAQSLGGMNPPSLRTDGHAPVGPWIEVDDGGRRRRMAATSGHGAMEPHSAHLKNKVVAVEVTSGAELPVEALKAHVKGKSRKMEHSMSTVAVQTSTSLAQRRQLIAPDVIPDGEWYLQRTATQELLSAITVGDVDGVLGRWGSGLIPDCGAYGALVRGKCECWDKATRRGATCGEQCIDYCNGRGICSTADPNKCTCFLPTHWTGDRCEQSTCGAHAVATGTRRDGSIVCTCLAGWGKDINGVCNQPVPCQSGNVINGDCVCWQGWSGTQCEIPFPKPIPCFHGEAVEKRTIVETTTGLREVTTYQCKCYTGWIGDQCQTWAGHGSEHCYFGLYDTATSACKCDPFWSGPRCDSYTCEHGDPLEVLLARTSGEELAVRKVSSSDAGLVTADPTSTTVEERAFAARWALRQVTVSDESAQVGGVGANGNVQPTVADRYRVDLDCRCHDGYTGDACDVHCREPCNWRGTACVANAAGEDVLQVTSGLAQCTCDDGFTGTRCERSSWAARASALSAARPTDVVPATVTVNSNPRPSPSPSASTRRRASAAAGGMRGLADTTEDENSATTYTAVLSQTKAAWLAREVEVASGRTGLSVCAQVDAGSVVSGRARTNGEDDEVVSCLPFVVEVSASNVTEAAVLSLTVPATVTDSIDGSTMYVAVARADGADCVSGSGSAASRGSARSNYDAETGTVTAELCGEGTYVAALVQPNLEQRASIEGTSVESSGNSQTGLALSPASLAGIGVAGVVVLALTAYGAYWLWQRAQRRERQRAVAMGRADSARRLTSKRRIRTDDAASEAGSSVASSSAPSLASKSSFRRSGGGAGATVAPEMVSVAPSASTRRLATEAGAPGSTGLRTKQRSGRFDEFSADETRGASLTTGARKGSSRSPV